MLMNTANTIWTLVAAFLVFGMQPGFVLLEAGFARKEQTVNVLVESYLRYLHLRHPFLRHRLCFYVRTREWFCRMGRRSPGRRGRKALVLPAKLPGYRRRHQVSTHPSHTGSLQFAFAWDTTSTVTSGAMIGRTGFRGDILYSIGVTGFIYPIIGHWAWGPDGWLALMGSKDHFLPRSGDKASRDFAGSTVVHTIGGMVSLAGAIVLGPRLGRVFKRDGGGMPAPHNLTVAAVGGFILWFGWYGFNPGSTLSAVDMQGIGRVAANTTLAACGGGIGAMYMALWFGETKGKFDLGYTTNGFLAGLVAITCPCYWVSPFGAIMFGLVAGIVVWLGDQPAGTPPDR